MADESDIPKGYLPGADDALGDGLGTGASGTVHRDRARLYAGVLLGALLTAFALTNLDDVKVHWIVGTSHTPLIIVVVVAFLFGMAIDRLILRARRRRAKTD
jgi:uncharacterized integral membrane protein